MALPPFENTNSNHLALITQLANPRNSAVDKWRYSVCQVSLFTRVYFRSDQAFSRFCVCLKVDEGM